VKHSFALLVKSLALSALSASAFAAASQQGSSCHLPGYEQPLRCVKVSVPVDYRQPDGAKMELHVTLAPALKESARSDPVFVLAGGPGQAGSDILQVLDVAFGKARATRDIVLIDQRGTGRSGKLSCDSERTATELSESEQAKVVADCMRSLNKPFAAYNTENSARDLEQIRLALGYPIVNVWGASYGTRLGQTYARLFPASVRSMILDGVAAPEQIIFAWGKDAQASLDAVFKRCHEDAACNAAYPALTSQFASLLKRVNAGAVTLDFAHPRSARPVHMKLDPVNFVQTVRTALYSAASSSRLPFLIDAAEKGNWRPFLAQMYSSSDFAVGGMATGLMLSVTCAEDLSRLTPQIVAQEERSSFLAGAEVKMIPGWCQYVKVPAIAYREPSELPMPVLLLSGTLDPVTPPYRADSARKHMPQGQAFVVANAGHGVSQLGCAPRLLREFLDQPQRPVQAQCLAEIARPSFQLGAAGPHP